MLEALGLAANLKNVNLCPPSRCLILLKGLVENSATSVAQINAAGFDVREPTALADALAAPDGVRVKGSRAKGRATVTARDLRGRKHFAAQISPDPITANSWTDLPGNGKRRKLVGYTSGAVMWVRFAALRGQERGTWGTPVSVIIA